MEDFYMKTTKAKLGRVLAVIMAAAMIVSLMSVQVVFAETAAETPAYAGWFEGDDFLRIEIFNDWGEGGVPGDVEISEGETLTVTFTVTGIPDGEYTAYLGGSGFWAFKDESDFYTTVTGDGTYTIEATFDDDIHIEPVLVVDIEIERPEGLEDSDVSASAAYAVLDADGNVIDSGSAVSPSVGGGEEEEPTEPTAGTDTPAPTSGYAWLGGTFTAECEDPVCGECDFDWVIHEDIKVAWELGKPFTITLADKNIHGTAHWGYILSVLTDIENKFLSQYDVFFHEIRVDGNALVSVNFDNKEIGKGDEQPIGYMRFPITNKWAANDGADAIIATPTIIGDFEKLEIDMAIVKAGESAPDWSLLEKADDGIPVWVWVAIGGGVVLLIIIIAVVAKKKK
jgi:hypothetical protein